MEENSLWYKKAVFYQVYVRAYCDSNGDGHGDLRGLASKLDYLQATGIDCLWLMPLYTSPLLDDGYDIAGYKDLLPEYGSLEDLKSLLDEAHKRGLRVILDLVLNHTSDQHPWFQSARQDPKSPFREYYVWSDDERKYSRARIIFLDTQKSNWTWDEAAGQYFWHRFYPSQPDLNYDNPAVQSEMLEVARFWLEMGVDGFRADAVPYLFEREGTNCESLPETHAFLRRLRRFIDENFPGRILLCEANQWPEEVREYFGEGDEFQMGFHFPLMPRIFMALRSGEISPLTWALSKTPAIPESCQWCAFLRNHDELTLEMVTEADRQWMWEQYAPEPRMRLNLGIRRRLAPLLGNERSLLELAFSLLLSLPGSPVIYYGDEIGMGDNIDLFDRNGVRTPMQWDGSAGAGFSQARLQDFYAPLISEGEFGHQRVNVQRQENEAGSLLSWLRQALRIRKAHPIFGMGDMTLLESGNPSVLAFERRFGEERLLVLHNLSRRKQTVKLEMEPGTMPRPEVIYGYAKGMPDFNFYRPFEMEASTYLWLKIT